MTRARGLLAAGVLVLTLGVAGTFMLRASPAPRPELPGVHHDRVLEVGGVRRSYSVYVPRDAGAAPALVVVLHGSSMDGARMREATGYGFETIADRDGAIVAYPDGHGGHWNDCRVAGDFKARRLGIDDTAFLTALIALLREEFGVARNRVLAFGLSNGGHMAFRLALEAPESVGAVAAVAASLPTTDNNRCPDAGRPVPVMIINGTEDPINPYDGGEVSLWRLFLRRGRVQSSLATARYWAHAAGASGEPAAEALADRDPADGTRSTRYTWTSLARVPVTLISVSGGGHTIPQARGRFPRILGRTSRDFAATEEAWQFLTGPVNQAGTMH